MKLIEGFENYAIGLDQKVWSFKTNKWLRPGTSNSGYKIFCLMLNSKKKMVKRSRLMYSTFVGEIPKDKMINHKDLDKWNDHPDNLELTTAKGNRLHYLENKWRLQA